MMSERWLQSLKSCSQNTCQFPEECLYYHYLPIYIQGNHFKWHYFCNLNKTHCNLQEGNRNNSDCLRLSISLLQEKLSSIYSAPNQQPSPCSPWTRSLVTVLLNMRKLLQCNGIVENFCLCSEMRIEDDIWWSFLKFLYLQC